MLGKRRQQCIIKMTKTKLAKILLLIVLVLQLFQIVYADVVKVNGSITYSSVYADMTVTPHTVTTPTVQWQYFNVTAHSSSGDLCVAYVFNDTLISGQVQLLRPILTAVTKDDVSGFEYRDTYDDVSGFFDHVSYLGNEIYYSTVPLHFSAYEWHIWRVRYEPRYNKGKWNLWTWNSQTGDCKADYLNHNYNFFYDLDPWWNANDVNETQGFVAMTNYSMTDSFEFYNYSIGYSFETANKFVTTVSATPNIYSLIVEGRYGVRVTHAADGTTSGYVDMTGAVMQPFDCEGDRVSFWFKYNNLAKATTNLGGLYLGQDNANRYQMSVIIETPGQPYSVTTSNNWTHIDVPKTAFSSTGAPSWDAIDWIRLYVYGDANQGGIAYYDYLYCYNSSNVPAYKYGNSSRYAVMAAGSYELQTVDNGFGFNTTAFVGVTDTLDNTYKVINITEIEDSTNKNFELIWKMRTMEDYGTPLCTMQVNSGLGTGARYNYLGMLNNQVVVRDDDGTYTYTGVSIALGNWTYFRMVKNASIMHMYYSTSLEHPQLNWISIVNYTVDTKPNEWVQLLSRDGICHFDNIVYREIIPRFIEPGMYHASYVYDTSGNSLHNQTRLRVILYNFTNPIGTYCNAYNAVNFIDKNSSYCSFNLTPTGAYRMRVYVYDNPSYTNYAYNYTDYHYRDIGWVYVDIYNEDNITERIADTIFIEFIGINVSYTNITTITNNTLDTILPIGEYELRYYGDHYKIRNYFPSIILGANTITLYALNESLDDDLKVVIRDFTFNSLPGAILTLQRWYSSIGGGLTVAQGKTDTQGIWHFYVDRGDAYYKLLVSYEGTTIFSTDWELLNDATYTITTDLESLYTQWPLIEGELVFDNSSLPYTWTVTYNNKDPAVDSVCLDIWIENLRGYTLINHTCISTLSGSIVTSINENMSHMAFFYYNISTTGGIVPIDDDTYKFEQVLESAMRSSGNGLIISIIIMLVLIFGTLYAFNSPTITIFISELTLILLKYFQLLPFSWAWFGILIPGGFVIGYYLNKGEP